MKEESEEEREGRECRRLVLTVTILQSRQVDTLTKAAGADAARCPGSCTGTARQRAVLNKSDEDM